MGMESQVTIDVKGILRKNTRNGVFHYAKKSTDLSVLSSGSNGARTRDLSRVRRTLIPAELCFHICYYSPFAEKYNLNLKIPLSRAKAAWPTAAPPLRHSPPETETQSGSPGALPDTAPFHP